MSRIIIKEARPEDAAKLIEYTKLVGAQSDNLSFGKEGIGFMRINLASPRSVIEKAAEQLLVIGQ